MHKKHAAILRTLKEELKKEGFIIDGIFGSAARSDQYEDIDILYHLEERFFDKYCGFQGFKKLEEIKRYIANTLGKEVDIAPIDNLSQTAKKYIFRDIIYV